MRSFWTWVDRLLIPIIFGVLLWSSIAKERLGGRAAMIWSDAEGYYLYLPATFVQGSWQVWDGKGGLEMLSCCLVSDSGIVKTRYTYGVAAMQAPFFLAAHAWTSAFRGAGTPPPADVLEKYPDAATQNFHHRKYHPSRGQATGFSDPYGLGLIIAAAFYTTVGLWLVRKVLRRHFSAVVASFTTILILGATNLYYYTTVEGGMSHAYSFCLFAAFFWLLQRWMEQPRWGNSLGIGACLALIFLIRPTNVMIAGLLVVWEVYALKDLGARLKMLVGHWPQLLAMAGMALLLLIPQMAYWQHAWGAWLVWSYEGEGFTYALRPKFFQVLFSHQNGLFLYTPIMLLAVVGMVMSWRKRMLSGPGMLLIFLLATYVFASWWAWWFGGAFGHRCYVEFYALLALPLAQVITWFWEHRHASVKWAGIAFCLACVYVNLKMTALYNPPWDGEAWTMDSYLSVLKNVARFWQ